MNPQTNLLLIAGASGVATLGLFAVIYSTFRNALSQRTPDTLEQPKSEVAYFGKIY